MGSRCRWDVKGQGQHRDLLLLCCVVNEGGNQIPFPPGWKGWSMGWEIFIMEGEAPRGGKSGNLGESQWFCWALQDGISRMGFPGCFLTQRNHR